VHFNILFDEKETNQTSSLKRSITNLKIRFKVRTKNVWQFDSHWKDWNLSL